MKKILQNVSIVLLLASPIAQAQTWTQVATAPSNTQQIEVTESGGIYARTTDNVNGNVYYMAPSASSFTALIGAGRVKDIAESNGKLFGIGISDRSIYSYSFTTNSWSLAGNGLLDDLDAYTSNSTTVLMGVSTSSSDNNNVYKSTNNGATWSQVLPVNATPVNPWLSSISVTKDGKAFGQGTAYWMATSGEKNYILENEANGWSALSASNLLLNKIASNYLSQSYAADANKIYMFNSSTKSWDIWDNTTGATALSANTMYLYRLTNGIIYRTQILNFTISLDQQVRAYYKFDGTGKDYSLYAQDLTMPNNATYGTDRGNTASSAVIIASNGCTSADASHLRPDTALTISTWVKPNISNLPDGFYTILNRASDATTATSGGVRYNTIFMGFNKSLGSIYPYISIATNSIRKDLQAPSAMNGTSWNHFAFTFSVPKKTLKLYINGSLVNTYTFTNTDNVTSLYYTLNNATNIGSGFAGSLDDFLILGRSVSDLEILALANMYPYSFSTVTDLENYSFDNVSNVYPNPVKDVLFVNSATKIYDLLGNLVIEGTEKIDVSGLANGVYVAKSETTTQKIVKE